MLCVRTSFFVLPVLLATACSDAATLPALMNPDLGKTDAGEDSGAPVDAGAADAARDASPMDAEVDATAIDAGGDSSMDAASTDLGVRDMGPDGTADLGFVSDCFLPTPYRDFPTMPWLVFLDVASITSASGLTVVERDQIITAVHQSAHTDVTTAEDAIAAVDEMTRERFWDDSNGKAVDVIAYYSGDNRYGAVFDRGSSGIIAAIVDGDMASCARPVGPLRTACEGSGDCTSSSTCVGMVEGVGKCVESDAVLGSGETCFESDDCAVDFGLVCTTMNDAESGMCLPAWMQTVVPVSVGALPAGGMLTIPIVVRGVATVDVAVTLGVYAPSFPRPTDLSFEVENPDSSTSTADVTADSQVYGRIQDELPLYYSGDERANGLWTLRVRDLGDGESGTIDRVWLRVRTRLD